VSRELFGIPNNWSWTFLSDIGSIAAGGTPSTKDETNFSGDISWLTPADLSDYAQKYISHGRRNLSELGLKNSSAVLLPKGSVLFSSRAPIGYVVIAENLISTNQGFKNITVYKPIFNEYVYYYLKSSKSLAEKNASGTTFLEISARNFSNLPIPIPPPSEQHRIVAKLEELFTKLDAGIEALKKAQAQLKRYRQSVLKAAVEGRLTAEWREQHLRASLNSAQTGKDELEPAEKLLERILKDRREKWETEQLAKYKSKGKKPTKNWRDKYKEPIPPDTTNLPELPEEWAYMGLVQYSQDSQHSIKRGPFGSAIKKEFFTSEGYKVYEQKNVIYNDFKLGNYFIDQKKFNELKNFMVNKGDILISCSGTIGEIAIVPEDFQAGIINQALLKISLNENLIIPKYFVYLFRSKLQEVLITKTRGSAMKNIASVQALKEIPFAIPTVKEQRQILNEIEKYYTITGKVEEMLNFELNCSYSLRQSILKHAFEGKLVPQDPNDLPASVLLERIKSEKSKSKKSKQMEIL